MENAPSETTVCAASFPPASWNKNWLRRMSKGRDGLIANDNGASASDDTITVQDPARRFWRNGNIFSSTAARRKTGTSICGLVSAAAARLNQAPVGFWRNM